MQFDLQDGDGFQRYSIEEGENGDVIINVQSMEDVTQILEQNKQAQREVEQHGRRLMGKGTQSSMYQLGEVSALQMMMLMEQGIWDDDQALRKWFNDLDNELWRIDPKRRRSGI